MWGGQWWTAAGSGGETSHVDAHPAAGAAAVAVALLAMLLVLGIMRSRRLSAITAGPPTLELRSETPAVVDLLTGGFEVEDDAVPATVVHLAARRWFSIEDYGDDTIIRTRTTRPASDSLLPYERRVLEHIEHHAIDGVVPTRVLTVGPEGVSERWHRGFVREVVAHAQQLGLCVDRWTLGHRSMAWLLFLGAVVAVVFIGDLSETDDPNAPWVTLGNGLLALGLVLAGLVGVLAWRMSRLHAQLDTPAGVEAASHWIGVRDFYRNTGEFTEKSAASVAIWDQHLAYATAMGLARRVQRQIPFETECDRHAWSRAMGTWRRVKVRYRTLRPGWGWHPLKLMLTGLVGAAIAGAIVYGALWVADLSWVADVEGIVVVTDQQRRWITRGSLAVAAMAAAVTAWMVLRILLGLADAFRTRVVEGEVVRRRVRGGRGDSTATYHVAVDTATVATTGEDTILAFRVRPHIYHQAEQGARVRFVVTPLLGHVKSAETLQRAPRLPSMADEPAQDLATDAEAASSFAVNWFALLGRFTSGLSAEERRQMAAALDDPKLAGTSEGTFLAAFLAEHDR